MDKLKKCQKDYEGLHKAATKAHAAMKYALMWINYDHDPQVGMVEVEQKLKDAMTLLDYWGAHP
jgi:hypothetical protein